MKTRDSRRGGLWARRLLGWAMVPALLCATGCSLPISVKYSPLAATESLATGKTPARVFVGRFTDTRTKTECIGKMKDVFGGTKKKVVTSDELVVILAEATTDALRKSGLKADLHSDRVATEAIPAAEMKGYDLVVGGRLKNLDVTAQQSFNSVRLTARVVIDACVRRGAKTEWVGPIEGTTERREAFIQGTNLTDALDAAMQNCMRNLVRHLKASGTMQASPAK